MKWKENEEKTDGKRGAEVLKTIGTSHAIRTSKKKQVSLYWLFTQLLKIMLPAEISCIKKRIEVFVYVITK